VDTYVAVTDGEWYRVLARRPELDEVNFSRPGGGRGFHRIAVGEPFFFKTPGEAPEIGCVFVRVPCTATNVSSRKLLGQRAFQAVVLDAYHRRCAITGAKIRPVLRAAHIRPLPAGGEHRLDNALLLRSDVHTLYDPGLPRCGPAASPPGQSDAPYRVRQR
jgi:hypothetical protein